MITFELRAAFGRLFFVRVSHVDVAVWHFSGFNGLPSHGGRDASVE
jgi:hypothetical protein